MRLRVALGLILAAVALAGCGDDGGGTAADDDLVQLLHDEAEQPEDVATCIADRLADDDSVDQDELAAIIRGEGSTDIDTADAYTAATAACAPDVADTTTTTSG